MTQAGGQTTLAFRAAATKTYSVQWNAGLDGQRVVSGSADRTAKVWEVANDRKPPGQLTGHTGWVWTVAVFHDGQRIVTGSEDRSARVWEAASGE